MGGFNIDRLDAAQRAQVEQFAKKNHVSLEVAAGILFPSHLKFEGDVLHKEDLHRNQVAEEEQIVFDPFNRQSSETLHQEYGKKMADAKDEGGLWGYTKGLYYAYKYENTSPTSKAAFKYPILSAIVTLGAAAITLAGCGPKQERNIYINNTVPITLNPVDYDKLKQIIEEAVKKGFSIDYDKLGEVIANNVKTVTAEEIASVINTVLSPYFAKLDETIEDTAQYQNEMLGTYMMTILSTQVGIDNAKEVAEAIGIDAPGFYKAMDVIKPILPEVQSLVEYINNTVQGLKLVDYSSILKDIEEAVKGINLTSSKPDLTALTTVVENIKATLDDIAKDVSKIKDTNNDIYNVIKNLPAQLQQQHTEVIAEMQNGTADLAEIKAFLSDIKTTTTEIRTLIENLPAQFAQDHQDIIDAINTGNLTAEQIRQLVEAMSGDVNVIKTVVSNLPAQFVQDHQDVIDAINNGIMKSEDIRALVEAILGTANEIKANTLSMDQKLAVIGATVTNLYDDFAVYGPAVTNLLTQILNKIPEGCNCKDYSKVFAEIKILIENIKDKIKESDVQDPHHEGILDDLDNIFA